MGYSAMPYALRYMENTDATGVAIPYNVIAEVAVLGHSDHNLQNEAFFIRL